MTQVNTTYDDALMGHIERIAAELGMVRTDYLRSIAEESVRAREQGRPMFEPAKAPLDARAISMLVGKLEQASVELDRLTRTLERREKKMMEAYNATDEANRAALERLGRILTDRFKEGATPFSEMLGKLSGKIATALEQILDSAREPEALKRIQADLGNIKAAYRRSRREYHFHLGETWKLTGLQIGVFGFVALVAVSVLQTWIASVLPSDWLANRLTLKMYGSADVAICELYEYSGHAKSCPKLTPKETGGKR